MSIKIYAPVFLHEKGRRKNNQDALYPVAGAATLNDRLFMVCDGVGGSSKGEVASRMVCDLFHAYFNEHGTDNVDEKYIADALKYTEQKITEYVQLNAEANSMSTTLTLLFLDDARNRAVVAWCGDSRVYHIRNGETLFVSEDHSLVQELVRRGEISAEEAQTHPQKNIILRAVSGMESPTKADVVFIDNLSENDFFVLCSDGILEGIDQRLLLTLLNKGNVDIAAVRDQIMQFCLDNSKDNFSMYLVKIQSVTKSKIKSGTTKILKTEDLNKAKGRAGKTAFLDEQTRKIVLWIAAASAAAILLLFIFSGNKNSPEKLYKQDIAKVDSLMLNGNLNDARLLLQEMQVKYNQKQPDIEGKLTQIAGIEQQKQLDLEQKYKLASVIDSILAAVKPETLLKIGADSAYFDNLRQNGSSPSDLDTLLAKLLPAKPEAKPDNPAQKEGKPEQPAKDTKSKKPGDKENYD